MQMPNVFFGSPESEPIDWKKFPDLDADDEEMQETPASLIAVLGFDPKELYSGQNASNPDDAA